MRDECTWHHKTFLVLNLAIELYWIVFYWRVSNAANDGIKDQELKRLACVCLCEAACEAYSVLLKT